MGNEFKDFEMETPSLTLEPDLGELEKKEGVIPKKQLQKEEVPVLTPEERKMVNDFAVKIDIEESDLYYQYQSLKKNHLSFSIIDQKKDV